EHTVEELMSKSRTVPIYSPISLKAQQGSTASTAQLVRRSAARASSRDPCPSLESDHSSVDNGPTAQGQKISIVPSEAQIPQPAAADPPILSAIRQILAYDPSYAEDVISGVRNLPTASRNILIPLEDECVDSPTSNATKTSNEPSNKRQRSQGDSTGGGSGSGGGTGGDRGNGEGGSGNTAGGNSGGHGADGTGKGKSNDDSPPKKKRNKDKIRRWICPYCLAYPEIHEIRFFSDCSANMTELHLWKTHLFKHHSQEAKRSDPNREAHARFYMSEMQQTLILQTVERYTKRPRDLAKWLEYWKKLFIEVWWILFPKTDFPHFNEPLSPFHTDNGEIPDLCQHLVEKVGILVEPILHAKAEQAVRNKVVGSTQDFVPSTEEIKAAMSETIAIALLSSPAATGATQWLARASPEMLKDVVNKDRGASAEGEGENEDEDESDNHGPSTPSNSVTAPRTPEPAEGDTYPKQAPPPLQPTINLRLFPEGTRVTVDLVSVTPMLSETRALQLTHPSIVYVANMSQAPISSAPSPPQTVPSMDSFNDDFMSFTNTEQWSSLLNEQDLQK
ncbi:unnamed protein product, partial [Fusarium langsethiae]